VPSRQADRRSFDQGLEVRILEGRVRDDRDQSSARTCTADALAASPPS